MVFSSVPVYLDPPNWQQQTIHHQQQGSGSCSEIPQLQPLHPNPHVGGGAGSVKPGSMADRARLAKIPQPEAALKCPRCDSTNTKFCYFNNYSLSQPRHFCKTCRRYWTRGGALRNVPVGGGCRRNKKSKTSSSKSPASSTERQIGSNSTGNNAVASELISHNLPQQTPQFPFMASLQNLTQYGLANIGLNITGIQQQIGESTGAGGLADMGFQGGTNSGLSSDILPSGGVQQFPFFEPPIGLFPFQIGGINEASSSMVGESQLRSITPSSRVSQLAPVKMEESHLLNLSRQFSGASSENNQYWGANAWTDLSGLNSSSTNHLL